MKEIIPLKKDILFKTTIGKITNINLEHDYKIKDNVIEGNVILSGTYKMTEASVLEEDFLYKIPFGISTLKNINKDTIKIEIDDFNYEINKDTLNVKIDLLFTCDEVKEEVNEVIEEKEEVLENPIIIENNEIKNDNEEITNITTNIIENVNKYYTYKIYIIRENDTIESICSKYNTTLDDLNKYNDLSNINIGDKIIIPCSYE